MSVSSRKEIRDFILSTTQQDNTQIGTLVNNYINMSLNEINDPGWAFTKNYHHLWSWLKRKNTFSTVASTGDYVMKREVDKIAILRQTTSPIKLMQITDELFFRLVPNPTDTGNPLYYRLWETDGISTRLATADTIDVISSSTSDSGSAELAVSVTGFDSTSGVIKTDTYQLNGTTVVSGTTTFAAREIWVSKQKNTTGTITIRRNSTSATLVQLGPNERSYSFKVLSLYPTPSAAITMYLEFYTRINELNNDSDTPNFDSKWHYVVSLGALAKTFSYLGKEQQFLSLHAQFSAAVRAMVAADSTEPDLVEHLNPQRDSYPFISVHANGQIIS